MAKVVERLEAQRRLILELLEELRSERSYRGIERLVQLVIQALLDLGLMLISAMGEARRVRAYRDVARVLNELGVLAEEDSEKMRGMVGLRNILVHAYTRVDRSVVIEVAERKLPIDAPRISASIIEYARRAPLDPPRGGELDELKARLRSVLKGRVKAAFLYGSTVKGYRLRGDVDVAVYYGYRPDPYEAGRLVVDLQEALGREDVDVLIVDYTYDRELLVEAIVHGLPVVGGDELIAELRARVLSAFLDLAEAKRRAAREVC